MAGLWEFPGGKLEMGETAQACIVRELAEELCVSCVAGDVFVESLHAYDGGAINLIAVHVTLASDCWKLSVHDEARWVGPDELLELDLAPADIPIAHKLARMLGANNNGAS
jgi:8-oxo-dGTP diphosphatase